MENPVTIMTRINATELYVPMTLLQSMGINCELKNGIANQVTPMYTIGDGGAMLLVEKEEFEIAYNLLKEGGFIVATPIKESSFVKGFDQITSAIPFFKNVSLFVRLSIFITLITILLIGMLFFVII